MKLGEWVSVGFFYGMAIGALAFLVTNVITTAINVIGGSDILNVNGYSLAAFGFGLFLSLAMAFKSHAKGE